MRITWAGVLRAYCEEGISALKVAVYGEARGQKKRLKRRLQAQVASAL